GGGRRRDVCGGGGSAVSEVPTGQGTGASLRTGTGNGPASRMFCLKTVTKARWRYFCRERIGSLRLLACVSAVVAVVRLGVSDTFSACRGSRRLPMDTIRSRRRDSVVDSFRQR